MAISTRINTADEKRQKKEIQKNQKEEVYGCPRGFFVILSSFPSNPPKNAIFQVEKELKRLLRADLEADSVKWEVVEDKKKETTSSSSGAPQVSETTLFGETVSSSDEEPDLVDVAEEKDD